MNASETIARDLLSRLASDKAAPGPIGADLGGARAVLRKLPTVPYNLLHLHYVRSMGIAEVARKCGCPEGAAIKWLDRAVQVYARQLEASGLIPSSETHGRKRLSRKPGPAGEDQVELFHDFDAAAMASPSPITTTRP